MWGRNGCVPPIIICLIFRSRVQSVKVFTPSFFAARSGQVFSAYKENSAEYPVFSENFQGAWSDFNPSYVEFYS